MHREISTQFESPCVVLTEPGEDPDRVIAYAREIGAECDWETEPGEKPDLVIDILYGERRVGPEIYSEDALRRTLKENAELVVSEDGLQPPRDFDSGDEPLALADMDRALDLDPD